MHDARFGESFATRGTLVGNTAAPRLVKRGAPVAPATAEQADYLLIKPRPREDMGDEIPLVGRLGFMSDRPAGAAVDERLRMVRARAEREGGSVVSWSVSSGGAACRVFENDAEYRQSLALRGSDPWGCYINLARSGETVTIPIFAGYLIGLLNRQQQVLGLWAFDKELHQAVLLVVPGDSWIVGLDQFSVESRAISVPGRSLRPEQWQQRCDVYGTIETRNAPLSLVEEIASAGHGAAASVPVCVDLDLAW